MTEQRFPDPPLNPESEPFYTAARESRFLIRRCTTCHKPHWYPRAVCPFCFGPTEWEEASGMGTIYSFSVMRRGPGAPGSIAYVTLAEGPTMMTALVDCDLDTIRIGQAVRLLFKPSERGVPIPCFRPA